MFSSRESKEKESERKKVWLIENWKKVRGKNLLYRNEIDTIKKNKTKRQRCCCVGYCHTQNAELSWMPRLTLPRCTAAVTAPTETVWSGNKNKRRPALIWQWRQLGKSTMMSQLFSWVRKQEVGHQGMSSKTTLPLIGWGRQTGCQTD